jgi:glycosyltransferase involved in cell wall biosynthesis
MKLPLVSVICLCYNQVKFIEEAVHSVLRQSYPNIQLIIIDDASTDDSALRIKKIAAENPTVQILLLEKNLGNCKAFNQGWALAKGDFVIDFAADDVMMPERIERQVDFFSTLDASYGVIFTNALYIDERGKILHDHYSHLFHKGLLKTIPQGDVYPSVLSTYFISSPTMMVKRNVMEELKGYDETLSYEDFDFWIRSARIFKYGFLDERLTKVRKTMGSMSTGLYKPGDKQLHSTYIVCKKAQTLNRSSEDNVALAARLKYELRQSVFSGNFDEADLFYLMLKEIKRDGILERFLYTVNKSRMPLSFLRKWYHQLRYG